MATESREMGSDFSEWQALTEAYEAGIEALRQRKPGAAKALMMISRKLQTCEGAKAEQRDAAKRI